MFTYFKNMPLVLLLFTLPLHLLANIWTILVFILRGSGKTILNAKWDAVKLIPTAIAARNPRVQQVSSGYIWHLLEKFPHR